MKALYVDSIIKWITLTAAVYFLSGCYGGGTVDIQAEDESTFIASASIEKKLSDRSTVSATYLATTGSNTQSINTGIQFNGNRVTEGTTRNRYSFQALTAHYQYTYFRGKRFSLAAAPALQLSYSDVNGRAGELKPTYHELYPAYGLKLDASFNFTDRTRAVLETAVYDQEDSYAYTTSGVWVEHSLQAYLALKFGYSSHHIDDDGSYSTDRCTTADAEPENCDESGFSIRSAGVHLGLELKR